MNYFKQKKDMTNSNPTPEFYISEFLNQVEKKLPFWLKGLPIECQSVLSDIENHIWDKAQELAGNMEPNSDIVREIIQNQMGSPKSIALTYRKQGKAKLYITEELFSWYKKTLLGSGIFTLVVAMIFGLILFNLRTFLVILLIGLGITSNIITIIFVFLSMQGFILENADQNPMDHQSTNSLKKASNKLIEQKIFLKFDAPKYFYFGRTRCLKIGIAGILIGIFVSILPGIIMQSIIGVPLRNEIAELYLTAYFLCGMSGVVIIAANVIKFIQGLVGYRKWPQIFLTVLHALSVSILIPEFFDTADKLRVLRGLEYIYPEQSFVLFMNIVHILVHLILISIPVFDIFRGVIIAVKGFPAPLPNKPEAMNIEPNIVKSQEGSQ